MKFNLFALGLLAIGLYQTSALAAPLVCTGSIASEQEILAKVHVDRSLTFDGPAVAKRALTILDEQGHRVGKTIYGTWAPDVDVFSMSMGKLEVLIVEGVQNLTCGN